MKERVLGLVPARGGSKGILRKNLVELAEKPLIQYTAEAALSAKSLTQVVLSTEDSEIAAVGRVFGLKVPFMRPTELAQDETPTLPVIQHALQYFEAIGEQFDAVCLLQPTSPLRTAQQIDTCVQLLFERDADTVISVLPVPYHYNPHWVFFENDAGCLEISTQRKQIIPQRQMLPPAYHRDGAIYVTRTETLMAGNAILGGKVVGYISNPHTHINIDTVHDLKKAQELLEKGL